MAAQRARKRNTKVTPKESPISPEKEFPEKEFTVQELEDLTKPESEPEPEPEPEPPPTEAKNFIDMLIRAAVEHRVTVRDDQIVVRLGDVYSYSLWMFSATGLFKSQHQYESSEG